VPMLYMAELVASTPSTSPSLLERRTRSSVTTMMPDGSANALAPTRLCRNSRLYGVVSPAARAMSANFARSESCWSRKGAFAHHAFVERRQRLAAQGGFRFDRNMLRDALDSDGHAAVHEQARASLRPAATASAAYAGRDSHLCRTLS